MKRAILVLLICCLLITSCTTKVAHEEHTDAGSKYVLENEMTVITKANPDTGMVAIDLLVKRSLAADGTMHGLGHFTNRLLLTGTEKRTREQIITEIESKGGEITARTFAEYAEILIEIPSEHTDTALDILADVVLHSQIPADEFEKEKKLVMSEIESKKDQPAVAAEELFMKTIYSGHPYANPIDGYAESVSRITREDALDHYRTWYVPNAMVIGAAGNINEKKLVAAINVRFGELKARELPEETVMHTANTESALNKQHMDLESAYIQQGYTLTPANHPDFIKLRLANSILGSGSGSRLFYELRDKRALAYSVYSIAPSVRAGGFMKIAMISRPDVLNDSLAGINEQVERIRNEPVSDDELNVVKQKVRGFFFLDHQKTTDQANYLALYELQGLGYHYDVEYPQRISAVTSADVQDVAQRYFHTPQVAIIGPFEEGKIS